MSWAWQPLPAAKPSAATPVTAQPRATTQTLENGFIGAKHQCFQPSEGGAIA